MPVFSGFKLSGQIQMRIAADVIPEKVIISNK